ncbi:MAG: DNA polymerase III subunit chi [Xanthomonadaceae bacterium]|nr:DNA polymerase III subunit chi [Xanthomonadaceae bacterium]MDE1885464.1 DNA polymerase III subunit chi [Xanthomonadaceae bacterium]MDE2084989.1 DNA polymerase III subunit chi [Xanthomonadaceae bacterium]MDE2257446.1 DNA polymerase III subunit chi [Xanthomonadaceae bacterium]
MPRADFYLIAKPRFRADPLLLVCELAKRAFESGQRALILARSDEQAQALDEKLWEFDEAAFVPHQIAGDADDAITPVLIVPPGTSAPDRALIINLRDEAVTGTFERVLEVVPDEESLRTGSRERWKTYKAAGMEPVKHDM